MKRISQTGRQWFNQSWLFDAALVEMKAIPISFVITTHVFGVIAVTGTGTVTVTVLNRSVPLGVVSISGTGEVTVNEFATDFVVPNIKLDTVR